LAGDLHAGALGQVRDRPGKVQVVVVHDEAVRGGARAAAVAVVERLVGADAGRRGVFLEERSTRGGILAGLLQRWTRTSPLANAGLRYQARHKGMRIPSRSMARK